MSDTTNVGGYNSGYNNGSDIDKRLRQGYYDDVLAAGTGASLLPDDMTKEEFDLKLAGSMNKSESIPFVLDLDKCVYVAEDPSDENTAFKQVPLIAVPLNMTYKKQYSYTYNVFSKTTQFQDGVQVTEDGLQEISNPITPEYAAQIVKAFVEGRPFYGKSLYELSPAMAINGVTNIPPLYDYNFFPISIKNIEGKVTYQNENTFVARFSITIPAKVGQVDSSLGIIADKIDLYLELIANGENFSYRAARYTRNGMAKVREANSPQVNGLLDLHKMMSFPDLLTLDKGDQLNVSFSADFLSQSSEFPGNNVGNVYYESYGYIYSSDFKMVHYDDNAKKFIYVPVSTNITLSDDKQSFQKIVCDFELDNKKYHMVFDHQQDNGLILTEKYSYDNNQTPFILDLDKYVNIGTYEEAEYQYIIAALHGIYMDESIYNKSSRPPMVASAFLEQMPSRGHLIYKLQDALDIYNAVMQHRPMFGKMGYGKNPTDPSLVKYPDIFPLYYDVYQDSKFNYTDENNFDLEFQLFINHPIGGQNPSLGYNKWGCMPFSLRFICNNGQFIYYLGIGTENPVIYKDMLLSAKIRSFTEYIISGDVINMEEGERIEIGIPNDKIKDFAKYGVWWDGAVRTVDNASPYNMDMEFNESDEVSGLTLSYWHKEKMNVLKFSISDSQEYPDEETQFTLQKRSVYDISSYGKRLNLGSQITITADLKAGIVANNKHNVKELFDYMESNPDDENINAIFTKMDSEDAQLGYFIAYDGSYRVAFFIDRQNSFYSNSGESAFYIYIPGDLDNLIAVMKNNGGQAQQYAGIQLIQRGYQGRTPIEIEGIESFGQGGIMDTQSGFYASNPSDILYCALEDSRTFDSATDKWTYNDSSLLKSICQYMVDNNKNQCYFYTNYQADNEQYSIKFLVDCDVDQSDANGTYLYSIKIYSQPSGDVHPHLYVGIRENVITGAYTKGLGNHEYVLTYDPDSGSNAFVFNASSIYDISTFSLEYDNSSSIQDDGSKVYNIFLFGNNGDLLFTNKEFIMDLWNGTGEDATVRINGIQNNSIHIAHGEDIMFKFFNVNGYPFISRIYGSVVYPF